jgi:hypothetical protein
VFCRSLFVLFLLAIVLSVFQFTASDYPVGIFWPLYCLSFSIQLLITPLVSFGHCIVCLSVYSFWLPRWYLLVIVLSVFQFTASDYPVGIFWPLYCLSFIDLRLLITPLVSVAHCIVCLSVYSLWLPRGLCIVSFSLQLLITPLVSTRGSFTCTIHDLGHDDLNYHLNTRFDFGLV